MFRLASAVMLAVAIAGVGVWLSVLPAVAQQPPSATRSFDKTTVEPGDNVTVTITARNIGGAGGVMETLPVGFTYVSSSLGSEQVTEIDARTVRFTLDGDASFTYRVTASSVESSHTFSGTLRDSDRNDYVVSCPCVVTVEAAAQPPEDEPSATRSFDKTTVEPGDNVTVTITARNIGGAGGVMERLPVGFIYVSSSLGSEQVTEIDARTVRFTLDGDASFTYRVTASSVESSHTFSGTLRDSDRNDYVVSCPCVVTVEAAAQPPEDEPSATRSFDKTTVEPGDNVTVTITARNIGGAGGVMERLPVGFIYVSSSLGSEQVTEIDARTVRFTLDGDASFTYRVTASSVESSHTFSGTLRDSDRNDYVVSCPCVVTIRVVASEPDPGPQVNRAPVFSAGNSTTRSVDENSASGANVGAPVTATDADRDTLTYSLTGTDAGSFTINIGTGQIMVGARITLDHETKASYMVMVGVTDGKDADGNAEGTASEDDSIAVTITVTDVVELGMVSGEATPEYVENGMGAVATYTADGPVTAGWSVSGADMDDFDISNEGVLSFASAPDFEMPMGGADNDSNTYMVTVKAEAGGEMEMVEVTVMVTNVDEIGTLSGPGTVSNYMENSEDPVVTYTVSGGSMSEMANLTLEGYDAGDFSISSAGVLGFRSSPDFENPTDADMDNTYMVTVKAEAGGEMAMQPVTVTVTNVDEDGTVTLSSNRPIVGTEITATLTDLDGGITDTTWQWTRSSDGSTGWANIPEATADSYTTVDADANMYLKATAMYTDGHGPGKSAMKTTANMVTAGDPLLAEHDANGNGEIDKSEVITAINDYLFGEVGIISKADVIRLINLYLFG